MPPSRVERLIFALTAVQVRRLTTWPKGLSKEDY